MKVTGYQLREAIKAKGLELSTIDTQWDESLYAFDDDKKTHPTKLAGDIMKLENKLATLQTAQDYYNLQVEVDVGGEMMTLAKAVKLVGGAGRASKRWRSASQGAVRDRWDRRNAVSRKTDEEYAKPTIDKATALNYAKGAETFASRIRTAIGIGNTVPVEIDLVTEELLS